MGSMQKVKCVCFCGFELVTSSVHVDFLRSKIRFKISVEATLYKDRLYVLKFSHPCWPRFRPGHYTNSLIYRED